MLNTFAHIERRFKQFKQLRENSKLVINTLIKNNNQNNSSSKENKSYQERKSNPSILQDSSVNSIYSRNVQFE